MPLFIIFCTFLLWIIHFLFSYILINTNYWIDDKFIKQSYRCSMKKKKRCLLTKFNKLKAWWCLFNIPLSMNSITVIGRWLCRNKKMKQIFYTHIKQALTNERMKLNIITKVKEVRRKTGSACGVSIHVHENTCTQEFCDKTQWVMVVWCRQWSICVSAGLGFIFYQFQSVFCQTFPFLDLKGVK